MMLALAGRLAFCIFIPILALRLYQGRNKDLKDLRYRGVVWLLMIMFAAVWIYSVVDLVEFLRTA